MDQKSTIFDDVFMTICERMMILVNLGQRSYNSRTTFPKYSDSVLE